MEKKIFEEAKVEVVSVANANDVIATSTHSGTKPGVELPTDEW